MRRDGQRVDVIAGTAHDRWVCEDYARAAAAGLRTVRDGIRWHRIERWAGEYAFSSVLPMLRAAEATGVQVLWDLFHYGWPDDLDFFSPAFVDRFAGLARAFARLVVDETGRAPLVVPVNEPSFVAWAAGVEGFLNPFALGRAPAIKAQLVRAAIAGIEAVWEVAPAARIVHTDPLINVIPDPAKPEARAAARADHLAQFESWDMLIGHLHRPPIREWRKEHEQVVHPLTRILVIIAGELPRAGHQRRARVADALVGTLVKAHQGRQGSAGAV